MFSLNFLFIYAKPAHEQHGHAMITASDTVELTRLCVIPQRRIQQLYYAYQSYDITTNSSVRLCLMLQFMIAGSFGIVSSKRKSTCVVRIMHSDVAVHCVLTLYLI